MNPIPIIDAHLDIAFEAIEQKRDFLKNAHEKRTGPAEPRQGGVASVGLPDLLAGNVRVVFGTLYAKPAASPVSSLARTYSTAVEAEVLALHQIEYYKNLAHDPRVRLIKGRQDLASVWTGVDPLLGIVVLMEGADPIVRPEDTAKWFDAGVRIVGPAWSATRYSGGTGAPGPLTDLGRLLIRELSHCGLILDISHMAEESFFQALDLFQGPIIASHSNARARVPTDRQLSDEMIRALINRGAVIGTVLYNQFLVPRWRESGADKNAVSLSDVVGNVKYICDLAGDARHVGIGSDMDGGFGAESLPRELDTSSDLQKIGDALSSAGFSDEDVTNVMGANWFDFLRKALPAG